MRVARCGVRESSIGGSRGTVPCRRDDAASRDDHPYVTALRLAGQPNPNDRPVDGHDTSPTDGACIGIGTSLCGCGQKTVATEDGPLPYKGRATVLNVKQEMRIPSNRCWCEPWH